MNYLIKQKTFILKKIIVMQSKIYENLLPEKDFTKRQVLLYKLGKSYYFLQLNDKMYNTFTLLINEYPDTQYYKECIDIEVEFLQDKKEYDKAIELVNIAINKFNNDEKYKKKLLEIYESKNGFDKALEYLENNFSKSEFYINKKIYYLKTLKQFPEAILFLQNNQSSFPALEYNQLLADLYNGKKDFNMAIIYYNKLYDTNKNIKYLFDELSMLISNNLNDKGKELETRIFSIIGETKENYQKIGDIYKELGFYQEVINLYDRAIKKGFDFKEDKIKIYEILGNYKQAIDDSIVLLNKDNFNSILEKFVNLVTVEEQYILVNNELTYLSKTNKEKKDLILKIQLNLYLKLNMMDKLETSLIEYLNGTNIDENFIESIINFLFKIEYYEFIEKNYNVIKNNKNLNNNSLIKVRYAQSLYYLGKYNDSLNIFNTLPNEIFKDEVDYFKALDYIKLQNSELAIKILNSHKDKFPFFNQLFMIYLNNNNFKEAKDELDHINKNITKYDFLYCDILYNLFLDNYGVIINDINKYMASYPNMEYANDFIFMLFILKDESVKKNNNEAMNFFKQYFLKNYKSAIDYLNKMNNIDSIAEVDNFYIAKCYYYLKDYLNSIEVLKKIIINKKYIRPYALELLGMIYYSKLNNQMEANKYFKILLSDYPKYYNSNDIRKILLEKG